MNESVRKFFPNASVSFIDANPGLYPEKRKPDPGPTLVDQAQGKRESDDRPSVLIILYRVRLLDKDNAYGATKCLVDCLREVNLIPDDSEKDIELVVVQQKVNHFSEQRTEVEIHHGP